MTLITQFNRFWKEFKDKQMSPNETMLFFYLLNVWNASGRKENFECNTKEIELVLGMNKMTFTRCRDALSKRGLIQYVKGDRKVKSPYYIICDVTNDVTNDVTTHRVYRDIEKEDISKDISKKEKLSSPEKSERMDWGAFMQTFNEMLSPAIPKVMTMSEARRKKVKTIVKEFGKEKIMQCFEKIRKSDFLMGRNRKPNDTWQCCFDWIFTTNNFIKILEGNYDNGASNNQANGQLRINSGAVQDQSIDIYKEVFGYDGPPDKFEEWFNRSPYGG